MWFELTAPPSGVGPPTAQWAARDPSRASGATPRLGLRAIGPGRQRGEGEARPVGQRRGRTKSPEEHRAGAGRHAPPTSPTSFGRRNQGQSQLATTSAGCAPRCGPATMRRDPLQRRIRTRVYRQPPAPPDTVRRVETVVDGDVAAASGIRCPGQDQPAPLVLELTQVRLAGEFTLGGGAAWSRGRRGAQVPPGRDAAEPGVGAGKVEGQRGQHMLRVGLGQPA
jgi:hypothetical protein